MEDETVGGDSLLRKLKPKLIDILTADPDLVLQHTDSIGLLTRREYADVKSIPKPSDEVRDLLDYVIRKGSPTSLRFLSLLQEKEMQETFPRLGSLKWNGDGELYQNEKNIEKCGVERQQPMTVEELPSKLLCTNCIVTEKDLMLVASKIGRHWKQFGRVALGISTVQLDQVVADNPCNLVEQIFAMLRIWSMRERSMATAKHLHCLLSEGDWALPPDDIKFLLEGS